MVSIVNIFVRFFICVGIHAHFMQSTKTRDISAILQHSIVFDKKTGIYLLFWRLLNLSWFGFYTENWLRKVGIALLSFAQRIYSLCSLSTAKKLQFRKNFILFSPCFSSTLFSFYLAFHPLQSIVIASHHAYIVCRFSCKFSVAWRAQRKKKSKEFPFYYKSFYIVRNTDKWLCYYHSVTLWFAICTFLSDDYNEEIKLRRNNDIKKLFYVRVAREKKHAKQVNAVVDIEKWKFIVNHDAFDGTGRNLIK